MNYYPYGNYNVPNYQQPTQITNKIYVTSKEDALNRFVSPNTITVYFMQDDSAIFEITTDAQGRKSVRTRNLVDVVAQDEKKDINTDYLPRKEFDEFRRILEPFIKRVQAPQGEQK